MKSYSIQELSEVVNGIIWGTALLSQRINGVEQLDKAINTEISFIGSKKYEKEWKNSKAVVAVVNEDISIDPGEDRVFIKVGNADLAMAQILGLFAPSAPIFRNNIHVTAVVDESAIIGKNVRIGAGCYIGFGVKLSDNVTIYPNVTIFDACEIGENTIIWSGTVMRERCYIGSDCVIYPNVTIGADGFGYRPCKEKGLVKIPQIGNVIIGNEVEIGANTCIDRAKFSSTVIGDGCKIDNLVQIGHNCKLGKFCIIAGSTALGGSVTLGNGVILAGGVGVKDHVTIGDGAVIGVRSVVISNVAFGKTVLGYPAIESRKALKQWGLLKTMVSEG
ncbi:UDP-3-O-(3-hydroxymyristoyl)glucosamine N-acyltransferase [Flavobacterium sp. N502540]|uniref:UDP-3-O-(3-hydroxymyristoyl)glucosamine N-acyltransferase n=1 Tax=Flavobacterium sp. N502540 TaxID=2986838 RepID=UPI002225742C|nr:UDP-3-O-(3-hydroxymyristoyl)glucosamine N-acyltransferase [Flavobacterium sp. N502540]